MLHAVHLGPGCSSGHVAITQLFRLQGLWTNVEFIHPCCLCCSYWNTTFCLHFEDIPLIFSSSFSVDWLDLNNDIIVFFLELLYGRIWISFKFWSVYWFCYMYCIKATWFDVFQRTHGVEGSDCCVLTMGWVLSCRPVIGLLVYK